MIAILTLGVIVLAWKLYQSNKRQQIAYNRYMNDRVVQQPMSRPTYFIGPNGEKRPMWCPNCGRNL